MARSRQLNVRLTPATLLCLEALRGPRQSQADLLSGLLISECERRQDSFAQAGDEERAGDYADALWHFDHEAGRTDGGRRPSPPHHGQFWDRRPEPEEAELAAALAAAWNALGSRRTLSGLMVSGLLTEIRGLVAPDSSLPTDHPARRRCARALAAYNALFARPATEATGA